MAKKLNTGKKPAVKKPAVKKETVIKVPANPGEEEIPKKSAKENPLKHMSGLEKYYHSKTKKELQPFVEAAMDTIREIEEEPRLKWYMDHATEHAKHFEETKDFKSAMHHTAHIISNLNKILTA